MCLASLLAVVIRPAAACCRDCPLPLDRPEMQRKILPHNAWRDISTLGSWEVWSGYYAGNTIPGIPISPRFTGAWPGFPRILIEVGDHEILLDDSLLFASRAREAGVEVDLHVWEGMVHCFPLVAPMFPEATQAWQEIIAFIRKHLQAG